MDANVQAVAENLNESILSEDEENKPQEKTIWQKQ